MKNGSEAKAVPGDSRKRYRARGQRQEKTDCAELQSDCKIRYRASEKKYIYLDQVTLTKLLLKEGIQRFSIDADINHFILQLFCRGSQENIPTHFHVDFFSWLNSLSHDLIRFVWRLVSINSYDSKRACWSRKQSHKSISLTYILISI